MAKNHTFVQFLPPPPTARRIQSPSPSDNYEEIKVDNFIANNWIIMTFDQESFCDQTFRYCSILHPDVKVKCSDQTFYESLNTRFLEGSRGVSGKKIFEPKTFGKIDFYCIFGPLFSKICQNFLKRHPRRRFSGPSGPKMFKRSPLRKFWSSDTPLRRPKESVKGVGKW